MKKTVRAIVAILLSAVMMLGMTAFAFAADETTEMIEWSDLFSDDYNFYFSSLVLEEGENLISITDINADYLEIGKDEFRGLNTVCYEFEAGQSGYYLMSSDYNTVYSVAEDYNGEIAKGCCEFVKYGEKPYHLIFYIEEGTALVGITYSIDSYCVADTVNIEYLGSEIKDYNLSEESLDDFVIGLNVWDDNSGEIAVATDCEIHFSPDNKFTANDIVLMGTCPVTAKEGKSEATVELFGIKKDVQFTAYYIDSIVESVEITNLDKHTVFTKDYKGEQHFEESSGETVTVKFKDGTEYSAVLNESIAEIVLSTGATATAYAGLSYNDDGSYDFIISVGDKIFEKYDVTETNKSFIENIGTLTEDNFESLRRSGEDFVVGIQYLGSDNEFMLGCFKMIFEDFWQIFVNYFSFIKYYIG